MAAETVGGDVDAEVIIVGAGPVGLVLANMLGGEGVRTVVLERHPGIVDAPRAAHFDGEIMRVFESIGLADRISAITRPVGNMRFEDERGDELFSVGFEDEGRQGWPDANLFHQPDLERVLMSGLERYSHVVVRYDTEVVDLEDGASGATLRTADGTLYTARYIVGCDGATSFVRHQLGIEWEIVGPAQPWLVVDARLVGDDSPLPLGALQHPWPSRPHFFVRNVGNLLRWEFRVMPSEDPDELAHPAQLRELIRPTIDPDAVEIVRAAPYTFRSHIASSWARGNVFLAGDAAHLQPPFMAQGMCSGIRDAAALSWQLVRALGGDSRFLAGYEIERRPHARAWIDEATRISELCQIIDAAQASERDGILRESRRQLAPITPRLGDGIGRFGEDDRCGTLSDRLLLGDGTALDDVARRRFVVLVRSDEEIARVLPDDVVVVEATGGSAATLLDDTGAQAILIRPDRYIAGVARAPEDVRSMLGQVAMAT